MSCQWEDNEYLDFKELEEQITQIVDNGNLDEMLRIQLSELEMLQSMFSNPGEFCVDDYSVIADINEFVDGRCNLYPPRLDFTINLFIDKVKLEVCVNLPHDYPATEPDIFVRSDKLSRNQQHTLNDDLANYISTLDRGEICICSAISWLQENSSRYIEAKPEPSAVTICEEDDNFFTRYWIYSHHIFSKIKRREILDLANEYNITGFSLPGRPGIICGEGAARDCSEWWQKVKAMNWKRIMCKKKEASKLESATVDSLRKFSTFQEISFESGKRKSRDCHMDMGELYRYLAEHQCSYVFKDYFGVDGGRATLHNNHSANAVRKSV
ncbi:RWD domain-containing protein 2A isoform X2 [Anabrus simplex]|uniref:RWD domain-containing protein 2A isoform X2 n=1 Tax=Anabrus simplex TaxID=316456 RepID=UPI0035A2FF3C